MNRSHKVRRDPRNGNYIARFEHAGIRKTFNLGTNKKAAQERLREIEQKVRSGKIVIGMVQTSQVIQRDGTRDMRIEELVVEHLDWLQNSGRAIGTIKNRQCQLNRFLEFIGPAMVSDITRIRLEDYYGWLKQCHSRGENGGVEAMSHLKAALKWAQEMDLCDFAYGRFPPISRVAPPTKRISDDDLPRLLAAADPDFKDMLLFGLMTGLRPKEQRELQRCHCQKDATGSYYVIIQRHKTSRSAKVPTPRSVPLAPAAEEILRRQLDNHSKSQFVFLNASGTPYRQYGYRQRLERLCDRAKTQHYSPYSLRHSFASLQSESGVETRKHALRTEPRTH